MTDTKTSTRRFSGPFSWYTSHYVGPASGLLRADEAKFFQARTLLIDLGYSSATLWPLRRSVPRCRRLYIGHRRVPDGTLLFGNRLIWMTIKIIF